MKAAIILILFTAAMGLLSCGKNTGYVKVKNQSLETLENVKWGSSTSLGNILSGKSADVETDKTGKEYIYFSISGTAYKSTAEIKVDANTGATYTITDSTDYLLD